MHEIELIDRRRKREKHFLQENGEIVAKIYDQDVHFFKNGKFEEIDNTLIENKKYFSNNSNDFKVKFNKSFELNMIEVQKEKYYLNIKLENVHINQIKNEIKLSNTIKYLEIFNNIDLEYSVISNKVKESIILNDRNSISLLDKIVFSIDTNLELRQNKDKSISALDGKNIVFTFDNPCMIDKNNNINNNVCYNIELKNNKYFLSLNVDKEWLNEKNIIYPVYIDPTITNYGQDNDVYDTYIYPNDTNVNRNGYDYLKVGVERINNQDIVNRALIKFELPTLGTGSQVIRADLSLRGYPDFTHTFDTDFINIYRVTQDWDEISANWDTMNSKFDSRVEGTFESSRLYTSELDGSISLSMCGAEITNLVRKWYADTPNFGIMLKLNREVYRTDAIPMFFSKDNQVTGGNPKPLLTITYRNQNGLEEYMNYQNHSLTAGTIYHNNYNGNLTGIFNLGRTIGGSLPISLNLVYNTNDVVLNSNLGYGLGYRLNLSQTIKETIIDNIKYLEYVDSDGTIHYFLNQKTKYDESNGFTTTEYENTFFDEDGLNLKIEKNDNQYFLIDKDNNKMKFTIKNNVGYLSEIIKTDNSKNTVYYDTNNRIIKVVDADNVNINITYNQNSIIVTSPEQTVTLNYDNNNLTSIVSLIGTTTFTYTNNLISSIIDISGKKIEYEYYLQSPYRLKKVSEYGINGTLGSFHNIEYGFNATTFTNSKGRIKTITFNNYGNPISISNLKNNNDVNNAYGMSLKYGETNNGDTKYTNKLLSNEIPLKYVKNYLIDSSFENGISTFVKESNVNMSISDTYANSGFKSLCLNTLEFGKKVYQNVTIPKGNYYTFSSFIRTDNSSIRMSMSYLDENGNNVEILSNPIISSETFERFDITINYPISATSDLKVAFLLENLGFYYIDDVQLEMGEVANNYNILENSDFSNGLNDWNLRVYDRQANQEIATDSTFQIVDINNNQKALKVNMNPAYNTSFSQFFNVRGKAGDTYTLSFWYKNEGLIGIEDLGAPTQNNIIFNFMPVNENATDTIYNKSFNPNEKEWQYFSYDFTALWDFKEIRMSFIQTLNANSFYITNLNLFKDVRSVKYEYDDNGNIIFAKNLNNKVNQFNYDKNNQLIKMTNPKGKDFKCEYDNTVTNRILKGISSTGVSNEYIYDSKGNPIITRITNRGIGDIKENYLYKIRLKGTDKDLRLVNDSISLSDDDCGHHKWILEKVTINNTDYYRIKHSIITKKYLSANENNLITSEIKNDNTLFTLNKNENGSYYIKNKVTDTYINYNGTNLTLSALNDNISSFEFYFEYIINGYFIENSAEYNASSKFVSKTIDTNFNETLYDIDESTGLINSVTNSNDITTYYTYNDSKQLTNVSVGNKSVNYEYNNNNLLSKISQDGRDYQINYDEFLNTKTINIGNYNLITNNYEINNGNLLSSTYGNGQTISYDYDEFNRIKKFTKMDDCYNYQYNNNGDLTKIISNDTTIKYTYDLAKRLYEYSIDKFKIKYGYDVNDNIVNKKYKLDNIEHNIQNTLNSDDELTKINLDNIVINYNYDLLGRLNNSNINNLYNTSYEYVTNGKRTSLILKSISNNSDKYSYQYDKLNNITHIYHNDTLANKYYYDDYNELIREEDYVTNEKIVYDYDTLGNIKTSKKYDLNDNLLETNNYQYNNLNWKDQLTKYNNEEITYDAIGNPLTIGNINLSWINGRSLKCYKDLTNTINYKYNKDGIRTSKIRNNIETNYYLEGTNIIFEKTGNNILYFMRDNTNDLIGFKYNDNIYYYIKNAQNDIIGILDSSYNVVAKYKYNSWGVNTKITDNLGNDVSSNLNHIANINPFRYRSYYYDSETKLYYLNSRYYNPLWGRFLNSDGIVNSNNDIVSNNLYLYCSNNPISSIDTLGNKSFAQIISTITKDIISLCEKTIKKVQEQKKTQSNLPDYTDALNKVLVKNASSGKIIEQSFSPPSTLNYFYDMVKSNGEWDYKLEENWVRDIKVDYLGNDGKFIYNGKVTTAEDFGNIHYGFVGTAMGFSPEILFIGGGYAKVGISFKIFFEPYYGDDVNDHLAVQRGIDMYNGL